MRWLLVSKPSGLLNTGIERSRKQGAQTKSHIADRLWHIVKPASHTL
jgi:hypothetical protein